jgi:hypothetical protein
MDYARLRQLYVGLTASPAQPADATDLAYIAHNIAFHGVTGPCEEAMWSLSPQGRMDTLPAAWICNEPSTGYNLMVHAVVAGNAEAVRWLLRHGWPVDFPDAGRRGGGARVSTRWQGGITPPRLIQMHPRPWGWGGE